MTTVLRGDDLSATPLSVSVEPTAAGEVVLLVGGDLEFPNAHQLRTEIDKVLADPPTVLTLDFTALTFIDSTGLATIVHAWQAGARTGTLLRLRGAPRFLTAILDLTGLTDLLARPPQGSGAGRDTA